MDGQAKSSFAYPVGTTRHDYLERRYDLGTLSLNKINLPRPIHNLVTQGEGEWYSPE